MRGAEGGGEDGDGLTEGLYGDAALCGDVELPDHSDDGGEALGEEVTVSHLIPTVLPWRERERERKKGREGRRRGGRRRGEGGEGGNDGE